MSENKQRITRVSGDEARLLKGETGYARLDAMTDDDIARAVADDPDAVPLDVDWTDALLVIPPARTSSPSASIATSSTIRAKGKGYQTLINQILRAWYEVARKREKTTAHEAAKPARDQAEARKAVVAAVAAAKKRAAKRAAPRPATPAKKRA
jgi:hypothetical protein